METTKPKTNRPSVIAKFSCNSVTHFSFGKNIELNAVNTHDGDNKDFADATPTGLIKMGISDGRPAGEFFKPGKNYLVTFKEVD